MTYNIVPASAGLTAPRHTFLSSKEVIARFGWGRTYGYQMLKSAGFPAAIGGRYRLDTLMAWEERVLAGELSGRPATPEGRPAVDSELETDRITAPDQSATISTAAPDPAAEDLVAAPTRRRTRGIRRAA
ncbi:MAG TPA: hypothetical protein VHO27_13180 [Angustibacter sp.]|nr:hypothetical protein [Angustibacter sp.]